MKKTETEKIAEKNLNNQGLGRDQNHNNKKTIKKMQIQGRLEGHNRRLLLQKLIKNNQLKLSLWV